MAAASSPDAIEASGCPVQGVGYLYIFHADVRA
jgi:hypothetical protein